MPKYILKRIVGTIPTLIIVVTFVFFFVRLIPGDPARLVAGEQATQDDVEAVREELGLNKSIPTQYVTYVTGLLKGNLGTSLRTMLMCGKVTHMTLDSSSLFLYLTTGCILGKFSRISTVIKESQQH